MEIEDEVSLNTLKNVEEMLKFWLSKQPSASWNQLIETLKANHIGLKFLARQIEGMLWPEGMYTDK